MQIELMEHVGKLVFRLQVLANMSSARLKVGRSFEVWIVRLGFGYEVVGYNNPGKESTSKFTCFI